MVQFKKSPVDPMEPALKDSLHPDTEIWIMPVTGEAFSNYDDYLRKLDYYRQKSFTCEMTGHGHMTYFDACQSEKSGKTQMETTFPVPLREPLLRRVQFQQINRLESLVDFLYDEFKEEYFPKETVHIDAAETHQTLTGVVTTKTKFGAHAGKPAATRYFIELKSGGTALMDSKFVRRDRRVFTKQVLRSFLRYAIERDSYDSAPWMVKEHFAKQYNISTTLPRYLTQDAIIAHRKAVAALVKSKIDVEQIQSRNPESFEEMARTIVEHKGKMPQDLVVMFLAQHKGLKEPSTVPMFPVGPPLPLRTAQNVPRTHVTDRPTPVPPPPPQIKYPIEDLELKPKSERPSRMALSFQNEEMDPDPSEDFQSRSLLTRASVGKALSLWASLNIHSKFFILDSFTYDDFIDAMLYSSDPLCELLVETHCAVLKTIVSTEGHLEAIIPAMSDTDSSTTASQERSAPTSPATVEQMEIEKTSRASSELSQLEESRLNGNTPDLRLLNHIKTMVESFDWQLRIKERNFEHGGWEMIVVAILYHLAHVGWVDDAPIRILAALVTLDMPATREAVRLCYAGLDVNLRLAALECMMMLACTGKPFKEAMEERTLQQTADRKDKTDAQRRRKPLIEELGAMDVERRLQRPEEVGEVPANGNTAAESMDIDASEHDEPGLEDSGEDSEPMRGRRRSGRASELKRKHDLIAKERELKQAAIKAKTQSDERAAYEHILTEIETKRAEIRACEEEVAIVDNKIRENSCHRTRCLGVDRFCNRYWWFERNGMPFLGHESSSTAENGYMNGRLWVQGPGRIERDGFFNIPESEAETYRATSGITPAERREEEEGPTILRTELDWGYISTPAELDTLLSWLDDRGHREKALSREIIRWKLHIVDSMNARTKHLASLIQQRQAVEEPIVGVATRKKTTTHAGEQKARYACLAWTNGEAHRVLGRLHSEAGGKKVKGFARPKPTGGFTAANHIIPGKRETRRGTRY